MRHATRRRRMHLLSSNTGAIYKRLEMRRVAVRECREPVASDNRLTGHSIKLERAGHQPPHEDLVSDADHWIGRVANQQIGKIGQAVKRTCFRAPSNYEDVSRHSSNFINQWFFDRTNSNTQGGAFEPWLLWSSAMNCCASCSSSGHL